MAKRLPHMTGLQLLHGMKAVYFMHDGEKMKFPVVKNSTWLIVRCHIIDVLDVLI